MKTESELYDEFYKWLDDNMGSIKVPTFFVELPGFEMSASAYLSEIRKTALTPTGVDYYCDVLFEVWKRHNYPE